MSFPHQSTSSNTKLFLTKIFYANSKECRVLSSGTQEFWYYRKEMQIIRYPEWNLNPQQRVYSVIRASELFQRTKIQNKNVNILPRLVNTVRFLHSITLALSSETAYIMTIARVALDFRFRCTTIAVLYELVVYFVYFIAASIFYIFF